MQIFSDACFEARSSHPRRLHVDHLLSRWAAAYPVAVFCRSRVLLFEFMDALRLLKDCKASNIRKNCQLVCKLLLSVYHRYDRTGAAALAAARLHAGLEERHGP